MIAWATKILLRSSLISLIVYSQKGCYPFREIGPFKAEQDIKHTFYILLVIFVIF